MNIKEVSPGFFVSAQICCSDVEVLADRGIKTIICNRPDNESEDQTHAREIAAVAEGLGITFVNIPVVPGSISDGNIVDFEKAYRDGTGPMFAYCRTGTRSTCLWALTEVTAQNIDAVLSAATDAGFDLTGMRPRLIEQAQNNRCSS